MGKAEFDSLKNDFQSQLDRYNRSIDNKIDGAIAAYLGGIKLQAKHELKNIVSNYAQINWINDIYWYGNQKHWTDRTTIDVNKSNEYYVPELNEKRYIYRGRAMYFYDRWAWAWSDAAIKLVGTIESTADGIGVGSGSADNIWPAVTLIQLKKDNSGEWLDENNPWIQNIGQAPYVPVYPHSPKPGDSAAWWQWGQKSATQRKPTGVDLSVDVPEGSSFAYKLNFDNYGHSFVGLVTPDVNAVFPGVYKAVSVWSNNMSSATMMCNNDSLWDYSTGMHDRGLWYNYMSQTNSNRIKGIVVNSMMGRDKEILYNKYLPSAAITSEVIPYDTTLSNEFGYMEVKINTINWIDYCYAGAQEPVTFTPAENVMMRVPHYPTAKWGTTTSRKFQANGNYLTFGQGLPLASGLEKGFVQIEFNADVRDVLSGNLVDHKVTIDIKNSDFIDTNSNYVNGYDGFVDPDVTAQPLKNMKRQQYNAANDKIKLTIPVNEDDSLWLRLGPTDINTLGLYANISDLKISLIKTK